MQKFETQQREITLLHFKAIMCTKSGIVLYSGVFVQQLQRKYGSTVGGYGVMGGPGGGHEHKSTLSLVIPSLFKGIQL